MIIRMDSPDAIAKIKKAMADQTKGVSRAVLRVAERGKRIIQKRIQTGKSYTGADFAPYSEAYAKERKKRGRQVSRVDLNDTGRMLAAMQTRKAGTRAAQIFFVGGQENKKAYFNNKLRPFFGFSGTETNKLTDTFLKGFR